jgi:hypothetical protein
MLEEEEESEELLYENEADNIDDISDDEDELDEEDQEFIGEVVLKFWKKSCKALASDFAICGWYLCIVAEVMDDVRGDDTIEHRDVVERVITQLCQDSTGLGNFKSRSHNDTYDTFWTEWRDFSNKLDAFSSKRMCNSASAVQGKSYVFHKRYSLKVTTVLGYVACRGTSNVLGIGAAERSWGDVKQLKTDKRSHLSVESIEQQSIIFGAVSMHKARIGREEAEKLDHKISSKFWTDIDVEYDLGLTKYGVDVEDLQHPLAPARIFRGWIEDWEVPLLKRNDQVVEAKLLTKYHGLKLYCTKDKIVYTFFSFNLEFQRDRNSRGWSLSTVPPEYVPDGRQDDSIIGFSIDGETASMIAETEQDPKMNIEISAAEEDEDEDENEEE